MNRNLNAGFVSTRFSGTDGVTMESSKWAQVLNQCGHRTHWFAGRLDRNPERSLLVPEAFFHHHANQWIDQRVFGRKARSAEVTDAIHEMKNLLKQRLREFIAKFGIDLLIAQNILTIPMHLPLGIALTELIAEIQIPTIAHHHDFYWERSRFTVNAVGDYLRMAFPPNLPNIEHVVINSAAQEQLAFRTGISSTIVPNVLDFSNPPVTDQLEAKSFRRSIGLTADDVLILQPTRIIQRKGIEHAIELVESLADPRYKLVISHEAGDEGIDYKDWLIEHARSRGVDLRMINLRITDPLNPEVNNRELCTLWDVYPHADLVTYPSLYEGFGNAFLESVYFKKPILINRYATFIQDIEPRGFDLLAMDGYLTRRTVQNVRAALESPERREQMVNHNYQVAACHFSYEVLRRQISALLTKFFGVN